MGKLKGVLGKALSAVAVVGVAAIGVAAVFTIGSVISRKGKSRVSSPESRVLDPNQTDADPLVDSTSGVSSLES